MKFEDFRVKRTIEVLLYPLFTCRQSAQTETLERERKSGAFGTADGGGGGWR